MKKTHFIGIGGIGMSALARILVQKGEWVSGSDQASSYIIEGLKKEGVQVYLGHAPENVTGADRVVFSTDIAENNLEYKEARALGIPLLHRSDLLAELLVGLTPLLVTGTHGKTTTSSLLAHLLVEAGLSPAYAIGGIVRSLGSNGGWGKGGYFVAEADESDGSFLRYPAFGAIITNIDRDHLNYWKTEESLCEGFSKFAAQVQSKKHLLWCADDKKLVELNLGGTSYGFSEEADIVIGSFQQAGWKMLFDLSYQGKEYSDIELPLIGGHNVLNAASVFGLALQLGISEQAIRQGFASFSGVNRRAEKKGEIRSIPIYDDYAHHPTEIFATLRAMKGAAPSKKLIALFQPHRYTRTRDCLLQFGEAFEHADELIITDIYSAGEPPIEGITTKALIAKIEKTSKVPVHYVERRALVPYLLGSLKPNDLLITMGAGDITKVGPELIAASS